MNGPQKVLSKWSAVLCVAALGTFSFGCEGGKTAPATEKVEPAKAVEAPPAAKGAEAPAPPAKMRYIELTPEKIAAGKAKFAACGGCHGADASGKVGVAPRIASESFLAAASDEYLVATIAKGRAGTTMIPWEGSMKKDEIESVVAYLRSMQKSEPVKLDESPLKGDIKVGEASFKAICSSCHGMTGAGYQEIANGTGIGRKGFLEKATNGFVRYMIHNGKDQTAMRAFQTSAATKAKTGVANLNDEEIDGVIKYLRENAW